MFLDHYPVATSKATSTIFFKGLKASSCVLLIHGYTGTPYEMKWLAKQLNDSGYTVFVPRLAGHGTCKTDFLSSNWKDWLRCVCDAYIDLSAQYSDVYVGGHSMGGLLATILARSFNVKKLFLCAPAFQVITKGSIPLWLTPIAKYFVKEVKRSDGSFFKDEEFNRAIQDYTKAWYVPKLADFYKVKKLGVKSLPYIKASTLVVLSKKDRIVPFASKEIIEKNIKAQCEYLNLEKSSHLVLNDVEKEIVAQRIIQFLK